MSSYGSLYSAGQSIGVALNIDDHEITLYINGISQGVAFNDLTSEWYPSWGF
ncbi:MAG: hypothetical protein HN580_29890 [Deltaproteobacteria bacterium]|nr:hypothetical protein [Deltaproteobacteria bacterium]MBT4087293.1 hypothetical protein [Deltaproteobacteria bacterium]MBT4266230.1 hypothetical protein [Deltaproteobacteria bacterium]MBT4639941.1 hypothetical protein [Deltaproteobacteria bacterium]MBT6500936.1 hypothetical protein [Deltaproteobacteria bacterium]